MFRATVLAAVTFAALAMPAVASEPPSPREVAEAMWPCEEFSAIIDDEFQDGVVVRHAEPLEDFVIARVKEDVANAEHDRHWWNPEVVLIFPRYPRGLQTPAPWPVLREWRNRTIQCFYMVPPVPGDYGG